MGLSGNGNYKSGSVGTINRKTIFLLIGQKGSGKSFIGTLFDKEFGITFIRVEDWAKKIIKNRDVDDKAYLKQVFGSIEKGIRSSLAHKDQLVFESTGLTEYFDEMLERLKSDFSGGHHRCLCKRHNLFGAGKIQRPRNTYQYF